MNKPSILKIAIKILEKNLGVKPKETIAIITDTQMVNTAKLLKKLVNLSILIQLLK